MVWTWNRGQQSGTFNQATMKKAPGPRAHHPIKAIQHGALLGLLLLPTCKASSPPPLSVQESIAELMASSRAFYENSEIIQEQVSALSSGGSDDGWALIHFLLEGRRVFAYPGPTDKAWEARRVLLADPAVTLQAISSLLSSGQEIAAAELGFIHDLLCETYSVHFEPTLAERAPWPSPVPNADDGGELQTQLQAAITHIGRTTVFDRSNSSGGRNLDTHGAEEGPKEETIGPLRMLPVFEVLGPGWKATAELGGIQIQVEADRGFGREYLLSNSKGETRQGFLVLGPTTPYPSLAQGKRLWLGQTDSPIRWEDSQTASWWMKVDIGDQARLPQLVRDHLREAGEGHFLAPAGLAGLTEGVLNEGWIDFPSTAALEEWWEEVGGHKAIDSKGHVLRLVAEERLSVGLWKITVANEAALLPETDGELLITGP